jgi:hypothetical protein
MHTPIVNKLGGNPLLSANGPKNFTYDYDRYGLIPPGTNFAGHVTFRHFQAAIPGIAEVCPPGILERGETCDKPKGRKAADGVRRDSPGPGGKSGQPASTCRYD